MYREFLIGNKLLVICPFRVSFRQSTMAKARLVILLVGYFAISALAVPTSRIWGGEEAAKNGFSYVASVRLDGAHICGGTIIESRSILTAAHCVVENDKE